MPVNISHRPSAPQAAVILAGGEGTRIWPYAEVRNKCALPIAGVPHIRRLADDLRRLGVQRIVVVLGSHPGSVRHALRGTGAVFVDQPRDAGTAGAALAGIAALDDDRFLLVYGDTVVAEPDLRAVAASTGPAVLVDQMPPGEGRDWHAAHVEDGLLAGVEGHSADGIRRLCGVCVLDRSLVPALEANPGILRAVPVGGMPPLEPDLAQSLNDLDAEVSVVEAAEPVVDLDKPWHILQACALTVRRRVAVLTENRIHPTARVHDGAEVQGFLELGPGAEIGNRVVVGGSLVAGADTRIVNGAILQGSAVIGAGCRISDYCLLNPDVSVGNGCVVGHGAEMDGALFDGAYLCHYCEISGLVGASVDIGAATVCGTLRFDDGPAEHRVKGRRERPALEANATYFGDYSRTGVNVITMPGVKIGVYSCVGAGIVVYEDIPSRTLTLLKQETIQRPWGPERYGW